MFHRQNQIAAAFAAFDSMNRGLAVARPVAAANWGGAYRDIADSAPRTGNCGPSFMPQMAQAGQQFGPLAGNPAALQALAAAGIDTTPFCGYNCCPVPEPTTGAPKLVGLPDVCIPGNECGVVIETSVCAPFTVLGLFIPDTIARCLSLTRFRVGCSDLLINCDPIPAELFSCCEIDENMLGGTTVAANSPICLTFDNKCKAEIEFEGAIKGIACMAC